MKLVRVRALQRTYRPQATIEIRVTQPQQDRQVHPASRPAGQGARCAIDRCLMPGKIQAREMPDGLSRRATLLLVAVAFGLTFCVQVLLGGGSSAGAAGEPKQSARGRSRRTHLPREPDLRLVGGRDRAARCAIRASRASAAPRKPKRAVRKVRRPRPPSRPRPSVPAATAQPAPTAAPRYIPPAPTRQRPGAEAAAPSPRRRRPPTPPPSGEFDTTGEP